MNRVERGQLWVMWIHSVLTGSCLLAGAVVVELLLRARFDFPPGSIAVPPILLLIYPMFVAPPRRYRALGYAVDGHELHLVRGVLTRVETIVPLNRVQHIDVSQGPIEKAFGVTRLQLHTAGTVNSLVVLPGLARPTAEAIRDEIRSRIRQDAA
jgi:membrane protein YdbS with pleckstrin-like domain